MLHLRTALALMASLSLAPLALGQEANLRITEVNPATGQIEVTNTGGAFVQSANVWFCYRFVYPIPFATGTSWAAGERKVATVASLNATDSDLWLYLTNGFGNGNNITNGLKYGPQANVGRMSPASLAVPQRWPSTTAFLPAPPSGSTLAWTGANAEPDSWYVDATPSLGSADPATTVGSVPTALAWQNTVENFEALTLGDTIDALAGWPVVGGGPLFSVRAVNDAAGSTAAPPFPDPVSTRWIRIADNDPAGSNRFYSNGILAPSTPEIYNWRWWVNVEQLPSAPGAVAPRFTIQHDDSTGFVNSWGIEYASTGANLVVTGNGGTPATTPLYPYTGATALNQWVLVELEADFGANLVRARFNGGGTVSLPINLAATADKALFRLCYRGEGTDNTATILIDNVRLTGTLDADFLPPVATITRTLADPTDNQAPEWSVVFSKPVAPTFATTDIVPTGLLAGSSSVLSLTGTDPNYTVRLVTTASTANGTLGFDIPGGAVNDLSANPNPAASAPAYTIDENVGGLVGDVNNDGEVNVADVTALGNFIVNGDPLP